MRIMRNWAILVLAGALVPTAAGGVVYDEGMDGDLSGDRFFPTTLGLLNLGANMLTATSVSGDREYVTFTLGPGLHLGSIILKTYSADDNSSFMAVQEGTIFTEDFPAPDVANLLGWTHFGTELGQLGTDILDDLAAGPGAIGFTPPLDPGNFTFWIQETGPVAISYSLTFVVVPAPPAVILLGVAGAWPRRRRG